MTALPTNWQNNLGMQVDADFLNLVGTTVNGLSAIFDGAVSSFIDAPTVDTTTSSTFTDLATATDGVTATINASGKALIAFGCSISSAAAGSGGYMGIDISGATTRAADNNLAVWYQSYANNSGQPCSTVRLLTGLNPGATIFKPKFKVATAGKTSTFVYRHLLVIPFP